MHLPNLLVLLFALLTSSAGFAANDEDEQKSALSTQRSAPAQSGADLQQTADIRTQALQAASRAPEFSVQGIVVDLEPLLKLRQQYLAAQAEQDSAKARFHTAEQSLARTRNLHQQDIVSTRRLQEQQAQWRNDKALLATNNYQQQTLLATARLQWGEQLAHWFTQADNQQAEQFLAHRAQLLQISLPANLHLPQPPQSVLIDEQGRRDNAIPAQLISPLPQVDPVTQGERYFFKLEGRKLPFGARFTAWIADGEQQAEGIVVPDTAVVWHLGQAFVFIKTAHGEFERRLLRDLVPTNAGYFAASGFQAGEVIVTLGAQTLLSRELKAMIPDEDDD